MSQHPNEFIRALSQSDVDALSPHLRPVKLVHTTTLYDVGDVIDRIYFPHTGIVSLVVVLSEGEMVEAAMVGRDGVIGAAAALDGRVALNRKIVQIEGDASVAPTERVRELANASPTFRQALAHNEQVILIQAQQSAACNASHPIEARLCRWMLRARDLAGDDLKFTQEFIAQMLGVRRTSISVIANTLAQAGFFRYSRGHIHILNADGMREAACSCYSSVRDQIESLRPKVSADVLSFSKIQP